MLKVKTGLCLVSFPRAHGKSRTKLFVKREMGQSSEGGRKEVMRGRKRCGEEGKKKMYGEFAITWKAPVE